MDRTAALLPTLLAAALVAGAAPAQCTPTFLPQQALSGVQGIVRAAVSWDPDGAGPRGPVLVLGGLFDVAGDLATTGIVAYDFADGRWSAFGDGLAAVSALVVLPNGDLVAGGIDVHRWTGSTWVRLGAGFDSGVMSLAVRPNGDLIAGGAFTYVGTQLFGGIARWNGAAWVPMGSGMNQAVQAVAALPNGDVVAGGWFTYVNGQLLPRIARWDGTSWSALGGGISGEVRVLRTLQNGDLLVGGEFTTAGGLPANHIARWNGVSWSALGAGVADAFQPSVRSLLELANGDLVAGGTFATAGGAPAASVARWNGATWSPLGGGISHSSSWVSPVGFALAEVGSRIVAAGEFTRAGGAPALNVGAWDGTSWSALGAGLESVVRVLHVQPNGDVIAGGDFRGIDGVAAAGVARRDAAGWHPLGTGIDGIVTGAATLANGDLVVTGGFQTAGGVPAQGIARWNGAAWSALGPGVGTAGGVVCVAVRPNGHVYTGGYFHSGGSSTYLGVWDGATWSLLPCNGLVSGLAVLPNGDLVAGGGFTSIGGIAANHVARFDGTNWHPMGTGFSSSVGRLSVTGDGTLFALGFFSRAGTQTVNGIARWDGSQWQALGTGVGPGSSAHAAVGLPGGRLVVGGTFTAAGGLPAPYLAQWDGSAWSALGAPSSWVVALAVLQDGSLMVGGNFVRIGGVASPYLAGMTSTCPASAVSLGGGCASSGGANQLAARAWPWAGTTFRAEASGLPATGFAAAVTGFAAASLPLASVVPQGVVGCTLRTTTEFTQLVLPVAGVARSSLVLPNTVAVAGLSLRHQVVACETGLGGALTAVTSTNVVALVVGSH
ncbi:MAG: hypothetical protein JNK49_20540 [Planctomycetes bacterium]|nr:hypothetical protein [Planctomycetota bacterium]